MFSILGGVLAVRFRQPAVIGLIIVGAIVGPHSLGLIKNTSLLHAAIEIGAVLLLFTIGIEFNLQRIINLGFRAVIVGIIKISAVFLITFYSSKLLGFSYIVSLYFGVLLSITSTVIMIKILEQKGIYKREELPLLVAILVIEDIFGIFALTFFSGLSSAADLKPFSLFTSLLISLLILIIVYLVLQRMLKPAINWLIRYSTEDTITFISLGLLGIMSYIAISLKLSPSIGAFLAGNIISSLPKSKLFEKAIHPFLLTFTSLFFFSVGTNVNFAAIIGNFNVIIVLFLATIASAFASIAFGSYLFTNFSGRQAVFSALAMIPVGEFSLLIANEASSVGLGIDFISITAGIILLSTISMSLLIGRGESIYNLTANLIPSRVKEDMQLTSKYFNNLSWSMIKDKIDTRRMNLEWKAIVNNLFIIFFIISAAFFTWRYFKGFVMQFIQNVAITYTLAVLLAISVFYILSRIIKNLSRLLKDFYRFFVKISPGEIEFDRKIFRNIVLLCIFFIILVITPNFFVFFSLNPVYNFIVIAIFAGTLIYVYNASKLIREIVHKHSSTFNKFSKKYKSAMKNKIEMRNKKDE